MRNILNNVNSKNNFKQHSNWNCAHVYICKYIIHVYIQLLYNIYTHTILWLLPPMFWEYCLKSDSRQIATLTLIIGSKHSHPSHHLGFGLGCDCLRFETADLLIICLVIIISYTRMPKEFDSFDKLTTVACTNHPLQFLDAKSRRDTRV